MSKFCFSGKVISEFSLLNPQNNSKPLVTYSLRGRSGLQILGVQVTNSISTGV
jgi:hypothetical protein